MEIKTFEAGPLSANNYLLTDGDEAVLIDCSEMKSDILDMLDGKVLKYILLTHGHFDHVLGVNDSDYYISNGELLSTDSITFIPSEETLVNVGTKVIMITLENISITSSYLGDVTSCYEIAFNPGTITITPRVIQITTGSITKSYDFGVLTCHEANVSGLASGQVIDMKFTGELFYVGSIANTISDIKVYSSLDENAIDLTSNYTFKIYEGTLTYTERSA